MRHLLPVRLPVVAAIGLVLFAVLASAPAAASGEATDEVLLTLLHVNDTHGHLKPYTPKPDEPAVGGFAELAALLKTVRAEKPATLFLHGGDAFQGTLFYNFFKGEADFRCLNLMGLDAFTLGNHEFDDYQEVLLRALRVADFPILSANLNFSAVAELNRIVKPSIIREIAGVKVGIVGLTTDELFILTNPKYLTGILLNDPIDIAAREIEALRPQVDLVVLLTHVGLKTDLEIAATIDGVDVVIGGHSHAALPRPVVVTNTSGHRVIVHQAGEYTQHLGFVDLAFRRATREWRLVGGGLLPITPACGRDEAVAKVVEEFDAQISREVKRVVCKVTAPLDGSKDVVRFRESTLGNLIADALREHCRADVGLCNGGGIRASINGPEVTIENILEAFPFDNRAVTLQLKGSQLRRAFEFTAKKSQGERFGGFLQISGAAVVYDKGKVVSLAVAGQPVDDERVYSVAMSDFMASGGDGFEMFKDAPVFTDRQKMSDILIAHMERLGTVTPREEGRITVR